VIQDAYQRAISEIERLKQLQERAQSLAEVKQTN
jgi:hypothetical protein